MTGTERQIKSLVRNINNIIDGFDKILQLHGLPEAFEGVAKCL